MGLGEKVSLTTRTYLSVSHIEAAVFLAELASAVEKNKPSSGYSDQSILEHRAYVMASLLSSVAFLEAATNELLVDVVEGTGGEYPPSPETAKLAAALHSTSAKKKKERTRSLLDKVQFVLQLSGYEEFDPANQPFKDGQLFIRLRNALVHYEPEWVVTISEGDSELVQTQKLEETLRDKFRLNPLLTGPGNPFFLDKCLGYGCAVWGIRSAFSLADELFSRLKLRPVFEPIRSRIPENPAG